MHMRDYRKQFSAILECCEGRFSNPLFSIFLIPIITLHGSAGVAHAIKAKDQHTVR